MKKYNHLTHEQRYTISVCLKENKSKSEIARLIGVSKSTVSREIKRNSNSVGRYVLKDAEMFASMSSARSHRPRKMTHEMTNDIIELLRRKWSPETIVGHMKRQGRECVSAEWIYHLVRQDKADGGVLYKNLPHSLKHRRRPVNNPIPIRNRVSIEQRPEIVSRRQRFGDWEMDTIVGPCGKGVIVTLVERLSRKMLMAYCPKGKNAKALARVVVALLRPYEFHVHTITTDNGTEFAEHEYIASKLHCHVYFAHPYSSWEKGLIENTNKLIRQFIPKNTILSSLSAEYISFVQAEINLRPRKLLDFDTPKYKFMLYLHNRVALGC